MSELLRLQLHSSVLIFSLQPIQPADTTDHLLPTGLDTPLLIRYVARDYDRGDFLTFPNREGWDFSTFDRHLVDGDEYIELLGSGQTWEELAGLLQTWLFFGLLHAAVAGMKVDQDEFKRPIVHSDESSEVLTTAPLARYLQQRSEYLNTFDEAERSAHDSHLAACLRRATTINNNFNYIFYYGNERPASEVLQETVFAQCLLAEALTNVCLVPEIVDAGGFSFFGRDVYLRQRLLDAGWCPYNVEFMQANLTMQLQAYAFSVGSVRNEVDHSQCDKFLGCKGLRAGSDFEARHVDRDCPCEIVCAPIEEVVRILQNGLIPVITIATENGGGTVELLVEGIELTDPSFEVHCPYLALSHVWADGLGNSNANALPTCQLKRIGGTLASIKTNIKDSPIETWTAVFETKAYQHNTLAFWMDTLCIPVDPTHQDLRDFSISKMRQIYEKAAGVLAIDPDLLRLPTTARPADVLISTLCSSWRSRLWTYQEAALASNLYLAVNEGCFEFDHGLSQNLQQTFYEVAGGDIVQAQLLLSAWKPYRRFVWDNFAGFLTTQNPARALYRMAVSASHRSTSRGGDETICLATFLDLDVTPLLKSREEDRMPLFLRLLPTIPPEILFAHDKHLPQRGFRWAPKSFLLPNWIPAMYEVSYPKECSPPGENVVRSVPLPVLHPSGLGLSVLLSGIKFTCPIVHASRIFLVNTPDRGPLEVEVRDTGDCNPWPPAENTGARSFVVLLMNLEYCDLGIIAEVDKEEEDVSLCHWKGIVEVFEPEDKARWTRQEGHEVVYEGNSVEWREWILD